MSVLYKGLFCFCIVMYTLSPCLLKCSGSSLGKRFLGFLYNPNQGTQSLPEVLSFAFDLINVYIMCVAESSCERREGEVEE